MHDSFRITLRVFCAHSARTAVLTDHTDCSVP